MIDRLKNLFERKKHLPDTLSYEEAREVLEEQDRAAKEELAARTDAQPEVLYYLASDPAAAVRCLVAANPATPHHADKLLLADPEDEVRCELARKLARLLPDIDDHERATLRNQMVVLLETLACDQQVKVRQIIAEELMASTQAPAALLRRVALDDALAVCRPVLEYSPLLSDDDLKEIIALTKVKGAIAAIARRLPVSEDLAHSIASSLDVPAVAALLVNPNAAIREDTLNLIIDHAENIGAWHEPLALRPNLSIRLMRRLATFVASSLVELMVRDHNLDAAAAALLLERVRERIHSETVGADDKAKQRQTVTELYAKGAVDEKFVIEALDLKQREAAFQALALLGDFKLDDVHRIIESRNARRITALAWKAGLSMRTGFRLQTELALVPHRQLIMARDGVDYPLTPTQMSALLEPYLA